MRYLWNLEVQLSAAERIDVALLGLGVMDSGHHFLRFQGPQIEPISEHLKELRQRLMRGRPSHQTAEIAHRLFWVGEGSVPADFRGILDEFNSEMVGASPDTLDRAREVDLVAGGRRNVPDITKRRHRTRSIGPTDARLLRRGIGYFPEEGWPAVPRCRAPKHLQSSRSGRPHPCQTRHRPVQVAPAGPVGPGLLFLR